SSTTVRCPTRVPTGCTGSARPTRSLTSRPSNSSTAIRVSFTLAPDGSAGVSTVLFLMESGAISQTLPNTSLTTDLTVLGSFIWPGGTLNSSANNANVNIEGGGSITPPSGGDLFLGSTLVFGSSDGTEKTTTIGGEGNIDVTGPGDYVLFVQDKAKVTTEVSQV